MTPRWMLAAMLLSGCGYTPPPQTDTHSVVYRENLSACEDGAAATVDKQNAKTGLAWLASPVRRWGQIGNATDACMSGKGYGSVRWCTQDELRTATRLGSTVTTAAGLQCVDPPAPERRRIG